MPGSNSDRYWGNHVDNPHFSSLSRLSVESISLAGRGSGRCPLCDRRNLRKEITQMDNQPVCRVRLQCHASGIARNGYTGASRLSRTLRTWSYTPAFACIGPLRPAVCVLASLQSQISKHQALANTGLSQRFSCSLSVIYRPYRAKRMPFGQLFIRPPTTHAGPVACRPSPLGFAACASLPCVRSSAATPLPSSLRSLPLVGGATPLRGR